MIESVRVVQVNLNRSWRAFDLRQFMFETDVSLAIISEPPHKLPASSTCFLSSDKLAAILWRPESSGEWICRLVNCGVGFVVARFRDISVASCYLSPNANINAFSGFLDNLNSALNPIAGSLLACGDFNAHSILWGSLSIDRRGELVERWSAALDVRLLNIGEAYTCLRPQGCSIVDLSWASPGLLERVESWSVLEGVETLRPPVHYIHNK